MISLQKIITKLKSLIDKNTADITALNNDLANKLNTSDEIFRTFDSTTYNNNANWAC